MSTGTAAIVEEYDMIEALQSRGWLKLPLAVMQDVGPASLSLAGMLRITNKETFCAVSEIASSANVPLATCRKHMTTLEAGGWIDNAGRQHTRRGAPRRTCTLRLTAKSHEAIKSYGVLPWWATTNPSKARSLAWSSKAVLSIVMSRLSGLIKKIDELDGKADTYRGDEYWGSLDNLTSGGSHFVFSLRSLIEQTGLSVNAITAAKTDLKSRGIIQWETPTRDDGGYDRHVLYPREDFKVQVVPANRPGYVFVRWMGGPKRA